MDQLNKKKVFLIEDDADQIVMYKMELENAGFKVITSIDEPTLLTQIVDEKPDIIYLDLLIQNSDGQKILGMIKSNPRTKDFKVVILSNYKQEELIQKCLKAGAMDYLLKTDYLPEDLVKQTNTYLGIK